MRPAYTIISLVFICAIFFFGGFLLYPKFYQLVLPAVDGIQYQMDMVQIDKDRDVFSFVFAAVPFLLFLTWQLIPLYSNDKKTLTALFIIICMLLATFIRYKILVAQFTGMVKSSSNNIYLISIPFSELGFEWHLAGGLLVGCIISYLAFHNKITRRKVLVDADYLKRE